jgi:hypothetical protein
MYDKKQLRSSVTTTKRVCVKTISKIKITVALKRDNNTKGVRQNNIKNQKNSCAQA